MAKNSGEEMPDKVVNEYLNNKPKGPEIKKCPFCGGHASFTAKSSPSGSLEFAKCECDDCHAVLGVSRAEIAEFVKELCIAKWNRRVADDAETEGGGAKK